MVSTSDVRQTLPLTLHSLAEQLPDLTAGGIKIEPWILIRKHFSIGVKNVKFWAGETSVAESTDCSS